MKNLTVFLIITLFLSASCGNRNKQAGKESGNASGEYKQFVLTEAWHSDTLLRVPESALYDEDNDVIYVSNVNGGARVKDGNGFISILGPGGEILDLKWVEGMHAPKGLAIFNGRLYVSDIAEVIVIDIAGGRIIQRIPIEGAGMLNDITTDDSGVVYVSDTDGHCIYRISDGKVSKWLEGLNRPNGLLVDGERLLLASTGSQDFTSINLATKEVSMITEGIGAGDGIARTGMPGYFLVSDWNGEVFLIYPDGHKESLLRTRDMGINSADISYIPGKNLLLVPTFAGQNVVAYHLAGKD
jgi:outer membrane protein assembly factor BamB